jgi:hypothetical protein
MRTPNLLAYSDCLSVLKGDYERENRREAVTRPIHGKLLISFSYRLNVHF